MMLINIPNLQMGKEFYKLPVRTMCGITDSQTLDCQAGYDTMQNVMGGILGGADIIVEAMGIMGSVMTTSLEKMVIDEEIISRVLRIKKGVDTSDIGAAVDIIQEVAHTGNYFTHQSTFDNFRDRWNPALSNWDGHAKELTLRARTKYRKILGNAPETLIDTELDKQLQSYMDKALRGFDANLP